MGACPFIPFRYRNDMVLRRLNPPAMAFAMPVFTLAALLMIASGSIHAVVNAIVKGGRDKAAGRALTDGTSALVLLPATLLVPLPHGAWGWLAASALLHALYLYALIRAYRVGDLSAVYPVLRGTAPLITALVT